MEMPKNPAVRHLWGVICQALLDHDRDLGTLESKVKECVSLRTETERLKDEIIKKQAECIQQLRTLLVELLDTHDRGEDVVKALETHRATIRLLGS